MAGAVLKPHEHGDTWIPPTGEALAGRLFGVVMAGLCAVIVLMLAASGGR